VAPKAAAQGEPNAQVNLGMCYANGTGVPKDPRAAVAWYRQPAAQGHANAQYNLALHYYSGEGVPKDMSTAEEWLWKAAAQGHAGAQEALRDPELFPCAAAEQTATRAVVGLSDGGGLVSEGTRVRLVGLQLVGLLVGGCKAHNGKTGVAGKFDDGQFQVTLEDGFCGKFRPANLECICSD
jgi:hypothetical protein